MNQMEHATPLRDGTHPYQEGFLLALIVLAVVGLGWLFFPFLPGLFLAALLASSSYPLYRRIQRRFPYESVKPPLIMTVLMFFLVVGPILYLLIATAFKAGTLAHEIQSWFAGFSSTHAMTGELGGVLATLPIPESAREALLAWIGENRVRIGQSLGMGLLFVFKGITNNGLAFITSLVLVLFALFFFYRDGPLLTRQLKILTPLGNRYDDILFHRFAALATVLTASTIGVALLQGISFSLVTAFMGLPWFYLGVAIAASSFIPVVGGVVVWGPTVYTLYWHGHTGQAVFLAVWGALVTGFVIDNLLRPILMGWLAQQQSQETGGDLHVLDHTLLTVLSIFGGLVQFGILGLFFGPIIAAMAISVFEVYKMIHAETLDFT
ncbi:MAG: AI-2E family transporter [Magnetococcales bacterium]|nr:AI-2E family transporter [Magnetococcales bacterium]